MRKLKTCDGSGLLGSPGFEVQATLTRGVGPVGAEYYIRPGQVRVLVAVS